MTGAHMHRQTHARTPPGEIIHAAFNVRMCSIKIVLSHPDDTLQHQWSVKSVLDSLCPMPVGKKRPDTSQAIQHYESKWLKIFTRMFPGRIARGVRCTAHDSSSNPRKQRGSEDDGFLPKVQSAETCFFMSILAWGSLTKQRTPLARLSTCLLCNQINDAILSEAGAECWICLALAPVEKISEDFRTMVSMNSRGEADISAFLVQLTSMKSWRTPYEKLNQIWHDLYTAGNALAQNSFPRVNLCAFASVILLHNELHESFEFLGFVNRNHTHTYSHQYNK